MDPKSVWALQCLSSKNVLFWSQYIWCNCNECDMSFLKLVLLSHLLPFEVGPTYRWEKTQRSKAHALGGPYGASLLHQSFVFLALSGGPKKHVLSYVFISFCIPFPLPQLLTSSVLTFCWSVGPLMGTGCWDYCHFQSYMPCHSNTI